MVAILCIAGSFIALKFDRADQRDSSIMRTAPTQQISIAKQNHFVEEVAKSLNESYGTVMHRHQNLLYYRTIFSKSPFPHILSQMHPMIAPFTSYIATESRFMRYCIFMLQINLMSGLMFTYFTTFYRLNDASRNEDVLDQVDMMQIIGASIVGALLLLPFISEPLVMLCASRFQKVMDPIAEDQS